MKLRRRIVLTAAALVLSVGLVAFGVAIWLMKSQSGTNFVRARIESALKKKINGRVFLGYMHGPNLNTQTIDSIEIRDVDDSVLFASGPISFHLDLLELWGKRISLDRVVIQRPYFHLRRIPSGDWNYKPLFKRDTGSVIPGVKSTARKLGDFIVLTNVRLDGGRFDWTDTWTPARWLRGAARDSARRFNLARKDVDVQRINGKEYKVRHWDSLDVVASRVQIKDGDNGFAVDFSKLNAIESDPPFRLRDASGRVTHLRDTVTVAIRSFKLPGSSGSAQGMLTLKPGLGIRVQVVGDTVAMNDIAWLYPTMPTEGTGRMVLDIQKDSTSDHIDYALTKIDVQSTRSHLRGAMTFGVGEEILAITDVDLDLAPVNFKLFEQFAGAPLTLPWAGDLNGHVKARGGPLNQFLVDSMAIAFSDANNPGVVNRFSGRGMLDIVRPLYTTFYDFSARMYHFDLSTARKLDTLFPPLVGSVYGTAQLDSIWTDVRLRNADIYYVADSASVSHFTGGGRVTVGEIEMSYDLAMIADPVLIGSFALSYPDYWPLRGTFRGPFTVKGALTALEVTGDLEGEGGRAKTTGLTIDDVYPRLGATGTLELTNIDLARVLIKPPTVNGNITATIDAAVSFDSLANLEGRTRIKLGQSVLAGLAVRDGYSSLTFGDGLMRVDSLTVASDAFALQGKGALGLRPDRRDTLHLTTQLDSLGGFRQFIAPVVDSLPADSLKGKVTATAHLFGSLDSLGIRATANGTDVVYGTTRAMSVEAGFDIDDLSGRRVGTASLTARTMQALGIKFSSMRADARLTGDSARVIANLTSETGPEIDGGASVTWDSLSMTTLLDSLQIALDDHRWRLTKPARIHATIDALTIDTLELRSGENARVSLAVHVPTAGEIAGELRTEAFPLSDLGKLFQVTVPITGVSAMGASLAGTRDAPVMRFELRALDAGLGETRVEGLRLFGAYGGDSLTAKLEYTSAGSVVLRGDAMLPMDLAFHPVARRMLDRPMRASLDADSTDLGIIKTFWSGIQTATGTLDVHLRAGGTWYKPKLDGGIQIQNGRVLVTTLGLPYNDVAARIHFAGDSIVVDSVTARSGGTLKLFGYVNLANSSDPAFDLRVRATEFHAIANSALADLTITTDRSRGVMICCRQSYSTLSGALTVNGRVYIPDTYTKSLIQIDPAYLGAIDTSIFRARRLLPPAPPAIVENMEVAGFSITAGDNLTLKSAEANVGLAGSVRLNKKTSAKGGQLDLLGTLYAKRGGTYRLNLGLYQRTFAVDTGTINFYGDPDVDADMDLRASYTIRQADQRDARKDIRVEARVTGSLSSPVPQLSSPDARLSNADLISYLTWGAPSIEIGGRNSSYFNTATAGLITSGASALSANVAGGACNLSPATVSGGGTTGIAQTSRSILSSGRAGCGLQVWSNAYLRVDFGLCALSQIGDLASSVGLKFDLRLPNSSTLAFGADPSTNALTCTQNTNTRGFAPTPRQLGLDIFRSWRW